MKLPRPPPTMPSRSRGATPALAADTGPAPCSSRSRLLRRHPGRLTLALPVLVEAAVLHDGEQPVAILQNAHVAQRIAVDQQDVGEEARLDLAQLLFHHHDGSALPRRGDDRLHRREAQQLDEMLEVAGVAADRVPGEAV